MPDHNACFGDELLQPLRDDLNALHAVMHKKDLTAPVDLAQDRLTDQTLVIFANRRANGQALLWRRLNHAHIAHVDQGHMQGTRDRCGRHGQHIDLMAQLLQPLVMHNAASLLLVDHQQAEIEKHHVFLQQAMRADNNINLAQGQILQDLLLLLLRAEAAEQFHAHRVSLQAFFKGIKVLEGQNGGWNQDSDLALVEDGLEGGAQGHLGLSIADITTDQAIHRPGALHIDLDLLDSAGLVGSFFIGESVLQFLQPGLLRIGWESVAGSCLPGAIELEQVASDLLDALFRTRLGARPLGGAELAQSRDRVAHPDEARHTVELVGWNIEFIGSGGANQQVLALHAGRIELDQSLEASDAVLLVDDVIAGIDLGEEVCRCDDLAPLHFLAARPAEDLGIGVELDGQRVRLPAFAKLALDERQAAAFGHVVDIHTGADVDCVVAQGRFIAQHLGEPAGLGRDNNHALAAIQRLAAVLCKGAQTPAIRVRGGELRNQVPGLVFPAEREVLSAEEHTGEAQLAMLLQARLQYGPGHMSVAQVRRVLTFLLESLLHLLRLGIEVQDMVLQALRVIQDQQAIFGQVIQNAGFGMQIWQVERDVVKRASLA